MVTDPPMIFSTPVLLCPSCGHGIDPHGVDPGGYCGVGFWNEATADDSTCRCLWSPNDIAMTLLADEDEKIAQAIDARAEVAKQQARSAPASARSRYWEAAAAFEFAARIARNGGRDE